MKVLRMYVFVALLSLAVPVNAGYEEGLAAAHAGDYATALREFRILAEQGHVVSQFNLGVLNYSGHGVPQDYVEAYAWWSVAAAQGHENATKARGIVSDQLTPEQRAQGQARSRELAPGTPSR